MNPTSPSERLARRIVGGCAITACAAALFAILIRVLDQWYPWASHLKSHYGMAPHTGTLLLLLSAALWVHNRSPRSRGSRLLGSVVVGIVAAAGSVVIARRWFPVQIEFEAWLASVLIPSLKTRAGHMSPHTALTFLCTAGALGCLVHCRSGAWWPRQLVFVLAALALTSGATAGLGYAVGTPLLYGPRFTSMKWVTASIFILLNGGLIVAAFPKNWLLQGLTRELSDTADAQSVENRRALALIFLFFTVGVGIIGFYFLRKEQGSLRLRAQRELETVAELKAAQIRDWRSDRLKDANVIFHAPYAGRRALDALTEPASDVTRKMFTALLDPYLAAGPYTEVLVLDDKLNVGLVHPRGGVAALSPAEVGPAQDALQARQLSVADLHQPTADADALRLSLIVPIVVRKEGDGRERVPAAGLPPSKTDRTAAVIILRLDPHQRLFPLVQTWPTLSSSAELLLVRRDGDEGLYLSELRFRTNAALRLRFPLAGQGDPVVPGSLSKEGVLIGFDYRKVPVVAAVRNIPKSPWWLVAKIDVEEIYAPVRERARVLGAALAILVIAVALGLDLLWRRRDNQLLRWQVANERERLALAQRLAQLMRHANDIVGITDDQWRILEVNDRGLKQYGYTLTELQTMRVSDLRAPAAREDFPALAEKFWQQGHVVAETVHQRKDGSTFPVEVSIRKVEMDGVVQTLSIIRDITERKAAETKLREREALLRAFYDSPGSLRAIVELVEDDILIVSANAPQAAAYGRTVEEMANLRASELRVPRPVIDLWRDKFRESEEKRATVSFEYSSDFRSPGGWGLAVVCSLGPGPAGRTRFAYLAHDITARKQAEEALRHSEDRYRSLVETAQDAILTLTPDGVFTSLNPAFETLTGWPREEWLGRSFTGLVHPEDLPLATAMATQVAGGEPSPIFEIRVSRRTGDCLAVQILATPQWRGEKVAGLLVIARDVTERKRMEDELRSNEARLRMALEGGGMVTWEWDIRTGGILHARNNAALARGDEIVPYGSMAGLLEEIHPEDRERVRDAISRTVNEHAPLECDCRVRMPDGNYRWMLNQGRIILEADDKPIRVLGISMDITERKQAEEEIHKLNQSLEQRVRERTAELEAVNAALRESENRYRLLAETARDAIFVSDREGRVMYVNSYGARLFNVPAEQLVGKKLEALFPPEIASRQRMNLESVFDRGEPLYIEAKSRFPSGSVWLGTRLSPIPDAANRVVGVLGVARDITERKRAEEALKESEARNRLLSERAFEGIVIYDQEIVVDCNLTFAQMFGYERSELIGRDGVQMHFVPASIETVRRHTRSGSLEPMQVNALRKDGSTFPLEIRTRPLVHGNRTLRFASCRDLTEQKRAEAEIRSLNEKLEHRVRERTAQLEAANAALRDSEARLQQAAHAGKVGLWDWDLTTNRVFFSPEWKLQIGYEEHEISDSFDEWQSRLHPDDREPTLRRVRAFLNQPADKYEAEFRLRHKDGSYRWILAQGSMLPGGNGKPLRALGSHVDITELKRLEQQLVEVSDREQARIGQDLHDGLSQLLVSAAFDLSRLEKRTVARAPEVAALARQAGDTIDTAITQARGVARGLFAVQLGGDGLAQALRDLAANVAARHQVACEVHCPDSVPVANDAAATHLFRIAQEAVNNALKHAKPRRLEIRLEVKDGQIDLMVSDDGSGFVPGRRRKPGMGLHIMDYRARALNGTFKIERGSSKGTRVCCSVPGNQA